LNGKLNVNRWMLAVDDAVQFMLRLTTTVPELQPVPLQPENVGPAVGTAVKPTRLPLLYDALHVAPQLIPAGDLDIVPLPMPAFVIESVTLIDLAGAHASVKESKRQPYYKRRRDSSK
jgi:hypothetical protein